MSQKRPVFRRLSVFAMLFFASFAYAQETSKESSQKIQKLEASAAGKSGMEKFTDWFHNPTPWLSMDADIRWEWRNGWNMNSLNDDSGVSN